MSDGFGNVIESLAMLMQATGEIVFSINPLIKSKQYDPETGGLETTFDKEFRIGTVDKVMRENLEISAKYIPKNFSNDFYSQMLWHDK